MSELELDKKLVEIRPNLKDVSPLRAQIISGFGVFNVLLAIGLYYLRGSLFDQPPILANVLSYRNWAFIFGFMGLALLYFYWKNDLANSRLFFMLAIFMKSMWWFGLMFRVVIDGMSPIVLILWTMIMYLQIVIFVNFNPLEHWRRKDAQ